MFTEQVEKLRHLKRFVLKTIYEQGLFDSVLEELDHPLYLGYSVPDVIDSLENLSNLEQLEIEPYYFPFIGTGHPASHEWKLKSSIRALGMLQRQLSYCKSDHVFQSIESLSLHYTPGDVDFPVLPNLKTLALFRYGLVPGNLEIALQHFSSCSSKLTDLVLCSCDISHVSEKVWSNSLGTVKCVEIRHSVGTAWMKILTCAPNLRQYIDSARYYFDLQDVSFIWLVDMLVDGKISSNLQEIHFLNNRLRQNLHSLYAYFEQWLKALLPEHWPKNVAWDFTGISESAPLIGHVVINIPRLLDCAQKYHRRDTAMPP